MSAKTHLIVLGASDPEMKAILGHLVEWGWQRAVQTGKQDVQIVQAAVDGQPVHAGNAYRANGICTFALLDQDMKDDPASIKPLPMPAADSLASLTTIECQLGTLPATHRLDHHQPGDPGYGRPPEDYWEASSLGQVFALLGLGEPAERDRVIAAADHCLGHAYQGRCPGAHPEAVRAFREESRSQFQAISIDELRDRVNRAVRLLDRLPRIEIAGQSVADARGYGTIPELPEAAAIRGQAFVYERPARGDDPRTQTGILNGDPAVVDAWMAQAQAADDLEDVYGDPARGFAGAYRR